MDRPTKERLQEIRHMPAATLMTPLVFVASANDLLAEIDAQAALIDRLARLLKEREWDVDPDYSIQAECMACKAEFRYMREQSLEESLLTHKHKPDCEVALALREAGVEAKVEGDGNV